MPPAVAVGEQSRTVTRRVGRMPSRGSAGNGLAHLSRVGIPSVFCDQGRHPFIGQLPRHEARDLRRVDGQFSAWVSNADRGARGV